MSKLPAILYVDDEKLSHLIFRAVFEDDYEIHTALSAHEGLEILRREPIQLLITDQCMPEMTGAELLKAIRTELPEIGRVMLSAYSDIDAVIAAVNEGGVDRYVAKPWEAEELKVVIDQVLADTDRRQQQKQLIEELKQQAERERALRRKLQQHVPEEILTELLKSTDQE